MKTNTESQWYALILQALSVINYLWVCIVILFKRHSTHCELCSEPLQRTCLWPDAQRKTNGLSPVSTEIINIIIRDSNYWKLLQQLIKTCKPLVDATGNLETRDVTLTDCMLKLICCACKMLWIELDTDKDVDFWVHVKVVFNCKFHSMNTSLHNLTLFVHPLCHKLAISQAAKGRSFNEVCKTALEIARQWRWINTKQVI